MSEGAVAFVKGLLEFNEDERIGSDAAGGAPAVRAHDWWSSSLPPDDSPEAAPAQEEDGDAWSWDTILTKQAKPPPLPVILDDQGNPSDFEPITTPLFEGFSGVLAEVNQKFSGKTDADGNHMWDDASLPKDLQKHFERWDYISPYTLRKEMLREKSRASSEKRESAMLLATEAATQLTDEGVKDEVETHLQEMSPSTRDLHQISKSGSEIVAAERTTDHDEDS